MPITDDLCRSWLDLAWHFDPAAGSAAGVAAADLRLGRFDRETVREHVVAGRAIAGALEELPIEDVSDEIDRTALLGEIRATLARLEDDQPHVRSPVYWLDHLARALATVQRDPDPEAGARATLARLLDMPDFLSAMRETIRKPSVVLTDAAVDMVPGLIALVHLLVEQYQPLLEGEPGELPAAATEAESALTRLRLALVHELGPDEEPHAVAIDEDRYAWILHHRYMLRLSPGEVWRWGRALADEVEQELEILAAEIDPGRDWREVFETVRDEGLVTGDLRVAAVTALARGRDQVRETGLFAERPGEITVHEAPPVLGMLVPFVSYEPPAGDLTGHVLLAAPTAPADHEAAAWGRGELDRHRLAVLAAHDGWPGRHTQALAALAAASEARRQVSTPIAVAGWGCYAEELMLESGGFAAPEDRLAQRVLLFLRALRLVVDVGIHTRQLTPAAALDLLTERVPLDRHAALAEVRRACAEPGAAAAYVLGRRNLLELRQGWRDQAGPAASLRDFHEAVLAFGRVPHSLVQWGMGIE